MMFVFLLLSFLLNFVNLQQVQDEDIAQCTKDVIKITMPQESKKRPTVDPRNCRDLDAGSCTLFALTTAANHVTNLNNDA